MSIDNYCERVDPSFWSEPVNAITNAAFLIAAGLVVLILRREERTDWGVYLLSALLFIIGIGSFLFHTFAVRWAAAADVIPIMLFILVYLYFAGTRFMLWPRWAAGLSVLLYFPFTFLVVQALSPIAPYLNGSGGYFPVVFLLWGYAFLLRRTAPNVARGLLIGAGVLSLSLFFRSIDEAICHALPLGTHFLWHCLNAVMLGWMILVLARESRLAPPAPAR